ncbi:MAG: aminodeoxychorismate/anthranilate synthase component II [Spirochaetes bacterium]|jgi:anthranilate synthase/aminodeoxychorismate synthase-like glutamine amidotransferase|nr:aminodeoxychorismate/anthranilate synthase component II [Spirochaetota bacterium]
MICMIDNYDSFTYNIVNYLKKCGEEVHIFSNDAEFRLIDFSRYNGIVLSPGPSTPDKSGITLDVLKTVTDIPILGICLGMQAIGLSFGATVAHATKTMHGKVDSVKQSGSVLFKDIPETFNVVRYHSLAVMRKDFPDTLSITAATADNEVMALEHVSRPVYGVQFHPESYLSEHGMKIIKNFTEVCHEHKRDA